MQSYQTMSKAELEAAKEQLVNQMLKYKAMNLSLNMARGKPSSEQLDLSLPMLDVLNSKSDCHSADGFDCRNYCEMTGIIDAKRLFSDYMGVTVKEIIICGSSSLSMIYDAMCRAYLQGVLGSKKPWKAYDKPKFICPVPGYDKHSIFCDFIGFDMITVPLYEDGPDMDQVEKLVAEDESIKGMWCMPKYSNPFGACYSDTVVRRLASMKCAADDFRIFWDNAYSIHHLYEDDQDVILELLTECEKEGTEDMVYKFISTSKVSFPGSGIAAMAASEANLADARRWMNYQTIGHDKLNQLRHVRFFKDMDGMHEHMKKHAAILRPKFEAVEHALEQGLGELGIGSWTNPKGGYFISFDAMDGCAKKIVAMAKEAGLVLTGAGATYPYGKDPDDKNIRIAPSFPTLDELKMAAELFVVCVRLVSAEKLLEQ